MRYFLLLLPLFFSCPAFGQRQVQTDSLAFGLKESVIVDHIEITGTAGNQRAGRPKYSNRFNWVLCRSLPAEARNGGPVY